MSKKPELKDEVRPDAMVTLTLTLAPALSTKQIAAFNEKAAAVGESVAERVARLISDDLREPSAA